MTISSETARDQYTATGNTGFDVTFRFLAAGDLSVYSLNTTTGAETAYTYPTDYGVTGAGEAAGGRISFVTAPTSGDLVTIIRDVDLTQETDLVDNDPFSAEVLEAALDKLCMTDQQLSERIDRSFRMSPGSESGVSVTLPAPSPGQAIGWNAGGTALTNIASMTGVSISSYWTTGLSAADAATSVAYLGITTGTSAAEGLLQLATVAIATGGTNNDLATTAAGVKAYADVAAAAAVAGAFPLANLIINPSFRVSQRNTTFTAATTPANSDDTYLLDRWCLLSDGNDILDVSPETTTIPTGGYSAVKLDVETANKRAGLLQVVEAKDAAPAIGGTVSLSFKARKGAANATVDTLRSMVLAWSSTADTVTSDVVSAWNAEGAAPTLVANWTLEGGATHTLTDAYQTFTVEGISIDTASAVNIAVFLMIENDDGTVGDLVYITDVKLEVSDTATDYVERPIQQETALCQRFYTKSYNLAVVPGTNTGVGCITDTLNAGGVGTVCARFRVSMRTTPATVACYTEAGTAAKITTTGPAEVAATVQYAGQDGLSIKVGAGTANYEIWGHYTADAEL